MNKNTDKSQLDPYDTNNPLFLNAIENLDPKEWKIKRLKKRGTQPKVDRLLFQQITSDIVKFRDSGLKWKEVRALIISHHHTDYSLTRLFEIYRKELGLPRTSKSKHSKT